MQPVNDDMDNLFRQAAKNYPLSSHGADFSKVLQQLDAANTPPPPEKKRRRFLWLLLLLVPIPFVYEHHVSKSAGAGKNTSQYTANHPTKKTIITDRSTATPDSAANNTKPSLNKQSAPIAVADQPQTTPSTTGGNSNEISKKSANTIATDVKTINAAKNGKYNNSISKKSTQQTIDVIPGSTAATNKKRTDKSVKNRASTNTATDNKTTELFAGTNTVSDVNTSNLLSRADTSSITYNNSTTSAVDSLNNTIAERIGDTTKSLAQQKGKVADSVTNTAKKKDKKDKTRSKNFIYTGLIAGTDISAVKSVNTHGLGYNIGIVAGYRFGKHLAVESGLIWNYKKYFADGKYVSPEKLGLRNHTQVLSIDGSCGMIEIPITVQYHFGKVNNNHWYAAAGVSSYLMKKEEYYYLSKYYATQYYAEKEYKNSIQNWFSVLQISAGYQLQLGNKSTLRFEPYIKLPMSKIGIAQMPLSSAGINIGCILPLK